MLGDCCPGCNRYGVCRDSGALVADGWDHAGSDAVKFRVARHPFRNLSLL
jgi:hypothetical protein